MTMVRVVAIMAICLGVVGVAVGGVFIGQSIVKTDFLVKAMQQEEITLGIESDKLAAGEVIDSASEAEIAGDTLREHRRGIAPTYGELLGGERYDPTNPQQLTYAQALNLENYLYLAVLGFGVTQIALGTGAFMIITGVALVGTGLALYRVSRMQS